MIRRILSTAALLAAAVTSANAQVYSSTFSAAGGTYYHGALGHFNSMDAGLATFGFNTVGNFQVWCVDQLHTATQNNTPSWVTNMGDASLGTTRVGAQYGQAVAASRYSKAAEIANNLTAVNQNVNQYAIWATIHGTAACGLGDGNGLGACAPNAAAITTLMGNTTGSGVNMSEWYIITDKSAIGPNGYVNTGAQEFLAKCQNTATPFACDGRITEEDPTPEPATMSLLALGLAGMAGSSLRRRKK